MVNYVKQHERPNRSQTHLFFFSNKKNCAFTFLPSPFYCGSIFRSSRDVYTMMETRLMKMVAVVFEEGKVQQPQQMVSLTA